MQNLFQFGKVTIAGLHRGEEGQDLIEYSLLAALIALGAIAGMGFVAVEINSGFSLIGNTLINAI